VDIETLLAAKNFAHYNICNLVAKFKLHF